MSNTTRLTVRLPHQYAEALARRATVGGYASPSQLARCVLIRFLEWQQRQLPKPEHVEWAEELVADYLDPAQRKNINERL